MASPQTLGMFRQFTYQKTMAECKTAMEGKIAQVNAKIAERQERIARIRAEYNITDTDMINLLTQAANQSQNRFGEHGMSYSLGSADGTDSPKIIGAGMVQNIITEKGLIESEEASVIQMERVLRNLRPYRQFGDNGLPFMVDTVNLSTSELDYLLF
jgi:hypothetical protein